jgi:hypothetical protein
MKKIAAIAVLAVPLFAGAAWAQNPPATAPAQDDLAQFRAAYTSGDGLAYVVIPEANGEKIYRYGDASRQTAKKDTRGFMLFTCNSPHVFVVQDPKSKEALQKAKVVKAGEERFAELDAKYLAGCKNPLVKSAIPQATAPAPAQAPAKK